MNAFPIHQLVQDRYDNYSLHCEGGLTKRELFAAMIFQQFLQGAVLPEGFDASQQLAFAARRATESADALLAELAKGGAP